MTRYSIRMRLARLIAPAAIAVDPYPGQDGVFVTYRQGGVQWSLRADRFRLKGTSRFSRVEYSPDGPHPWYRPTGTFYRFVGTVGK